MSRLLRWLPVLAVAALLGAALLGAASSEITFVRTPVRVPTIDGGGDQPGQLPDPQPPPVAGPPESPLSLPAWLGDLISVLCIATIVALAGLLLWAFARERLALRRSVPGGADAEEQRRRMREQVRSAVDEGLSDLDVDDSDPRRAVIACWARLEAAAALAGTPREPGDTSTELVERLLVEHSISPAVLAGFAALYRQARFAPHVVDEVMRQQARAALRQVRDELMAALA